MRYFLDVAYKGTEYHGWQEQENALSIQQVINESLTKIVGSRIKCVGSGRTDTGVHATQQIVHLDLEKKIDLKHFCYQLNAVLPQDIAVSNMKMVKPEAHARFDAIRRTYDYFIHREKDPFKIRRSYFYNHDISIQFIKDACEVIKKHNDFESFSKVKTEVNNFKCEILEIDWKSENGNHVFRVSANRFLRGMVRTMVGTLLDIGSGKLSAGDLTLILENKDRRGAGRSVPAHGLYLTEVTYPQDIYLTT